MHRLSRTPFVLVVIALAITACTTPDSPVTPKLSPAGFTPLMSRIKATDSMMVLTDITYSDTATVLRRTTPLAQDITVSALIGPTGGSLRIDAAGLRVDIPAKALAAQTQITVTALKGDNVAYEFGPHGTVFSQPVKLVQDLSGTQAATNSALLNGMHGAYFDTTLDSSTVDVTAGKVKVKENQLGYKETGSSLRFSVGHFSGYLVSIGAF